MGRGQGQIGELVGINPSTIRVQDVRATADHPRGPNMKTHLAVRQPVIQNTEIGGWQCHSDSAFAQQFAEIAGRHLRATQRSVR